MSTLPPFRKRPGEAHIGAAMSGPIGSPQRERLLLSWFRDGNGAEASWFSRDPPSRRAQRAHGCTRSAHVARLVPASATVPTAATTDDQQNHDDDQKCRGVHTALLEVIMGRRASLPKGYRRRDSIRSRPMPLIITTPFCCGLYGALFPTSIISDV
jgi:hypothetical protein